MRGLIKKILNEDTQQGDDFDWIREPHIASEHDIKKLLNIHSMYSFAYNDVISKLLEVGLTDAQMEALVDGLDYVYEHGMDGGRDEGYDDGHNDGHSEGYDEGWDDGHSEGHSEGYTQAERECEENSDAKWQDGYDTGHNDGHSEGRSEGYNEAMDECGGD